MDPHPGDTDRIFEPLGRCRAFTWHGNHDYGLADSSTKPAAVVKNQSQNADGHEDDALNLKKPSTRRNAWGCMSYADLITKAIESVPEKRLTLSQIYGWMIQNVPYFRDKGESSSSAGWKNSVRHNLSLHRKFVRVQNEGTGKSSWWVVNNEVKSCKSPRRRAASMDTKSYEKKKRQAVPAPPQNAQVQTPMIGFSQPNVISVSPEVQRLDSFAAAFSPMDLRSHGRSAPLKSGLLSPLEPGSAFDDQVMTQPSPLYWNQCRNVNPPYARPDGLTETVGESLAELFTPDASTNYESAFSPDRQLTVLQNVGCDKYVSDSSYLSFQDLGGTLPSPPPYAGHSGTAEGLFPPQVNAKDSLQSAALSSQLDVFPSMQYMTRSGFPVNQGLRGDLSPMQKFFLERNEERLAGEPRHGNSVLHQMLMQTQQESNSLSGYGDHAMQSSVKSESSSRDTIPYPDARPFAFDATLPGRSTLSSADQGQGCELDYRESQYVVKIEPGADNQILKHDRCEEAWNLNMTSPDAERQKDS